MDRSAKDAETRCRIVTAHHALSSLQTRLRAVKDTAAPSSRARQRRGVWGLVQNSGDLLEEHLPFGEICSRRRGQRGQHQDPDEAIMHRWELGRRLW